MKTDKDLVREAFKILRKQKYVARMGFSCCSSCGWYKLTEYFEKKGIPENQVRLVFYNKQSNDSYDKNNNLNHNLYLQWLNPEGNAQPIVDAFKSVGLNASWVNEDTDEAVVVSKTID